MVTEFMDKNTWLNLTFMSISAQIKAARIALDISQEQLAMRCNLSVRTIAAIESCEKEPKLSTLLVMCYNLNISAGDVLSHPILEKKPKNRVLAETMLINSLRNVPSEYFCAFVSAMGTKQPAFIGVEQPTDKQWWEDALPNIFAARRKSAKKTLKEVAKSLTFDEEILKNFEQKKEKLTLRELLILADFYEMDNIKDALNKAFGDLR